MPYYSSLELLLLISLFLTDRMGFWQVGSGCKYK